jgi:hypothetical protein
MEILKKILLGIILIPLGIVIIPVILWILLFEFLARLYTRTCLKLKWPKGKYILFTYSESENWSHYIEGSILPEIEEYSFIINRSKDQHWKSEFKLERRAIELWANLNVNPIAIVFESSKKVKVIPFYEAFRDLKHGKQETINAKCQELFQCLPSNP